MSEARDTVAVIVDELAAMFDPLVAALQTPDGAVAFMRDLGWDATAVPAPVAALLADAEDLLDVVTNGIDVGDIPVMVGKIGSIVSRIEGIASSPVGAIPVAGAQTFLDQFPEQLLRHLIAVRLLDAYPQVAALLRFANVIVTESMEAVAPRIAYHRYDFRPENVAAFFSDPKTALTTALAWGSPSLNSELLADASRMLFGALDLPVRTTSVKDAVLGQLAGVAEAATEALDEMFRSQVMVTLFEHFEETSRATAGFGVAVAPPNGALLPGIAVLFFATGGLEIEVDLSDTAQLTIEAEVGLSEGSGIVLRPGNAPQLLNGLGKPGVPTVQGALSLGVRRVSDSEPAVLFGAADASRLEYRSLGVAAGARASTGGTASAFIELSITGGALVVTPGSDTDSFLAKLLPADGFRLEFDLQMVLDSVAGLSFKGAGGLQQRFPTHLSLGPISFDAVTLALKAVDSAILIEAGADLRGELGPLKAVVENVGLTARLDPSAPKKSLGFVDLQLGFKPPNGVGLSIDAAVVKGGGYLFLDFDKGEYAGALELSIAELFSVNAIGLITTRQPDGSPGFSLLVILTAEFTPGLQLGFGFTLIGVGGLVGLNRMARLDALAQGVRTGALDNILFPRDVVANAPRILSDLRTIFPQRQGTFLIGPMVKLGWGTPTLVSLSLGVIIEIPGNIAILGVLKLALPTVDAALIQLKVSFIGAIEFDRKRVWFFASLFDSRVLLFPLDGEMGLLMAFGDEPNFVLSVGGFHPKFIPPPLPFPSPNRLGVTILNAPGQKIMATGYFAVTSNTAQFGARVEVALGFDDFGVSGHIGFDALFRFSPFSFVIDASASFSLRAFGFDLMSVRISLTLEGPAPWRARGRGSVSLLFFEISADFDITWGETRNTIAPPIAVLDLVRSELAKAESWTAELPSGTAIGVTLRPLDGGPEVILHPRGTLRVSQRAIPLGLTLDKVGQQKPSDVRSVRIDTIGGGLQRLGDAEEKFALAQFKDMTDAEKLSRRAFESHASGVLLRGGGGLLATRSVARSARYETIIIDSFGKRDPLRFFAFNLRLFDVFLANNASARSSLSQATKGRPPLDTVAVSDGAFVVAHIANNRAVGTETRFATESAAMQFLTNSTNENPAVGMGLHVIPSFEEVTV
jgi:hypothetical protein